jgi:hypothetical protein
MMKLWVLKGNLKENKALTGIADPWYGMYDKAYGFVVRAETESKARMIAHKNGGGENKHIKNVNPWLDRSLSSCKELTTEGDSEMIIQDYLSG